jgi:hypothetical protein
MINRKIYPITKRHQLIDLNGENVNFKLEFMVKSVKENHEFNAIVLTQEQLDSVDLNKIEMKEAKNKISGNITANNNKYQNYFLVLKKKDVDNLPDFDVEVTINLEKMEENKNLDFSIQPEAPKENISQSSAATTTTSSAPGVVASTPNQIAVSECKVPFYKKAWVWIFIFIVGLVIGLVYYNYFYLKKPFFGFNVKTSTPLTNSAPSAAVATNPVNAETQLYNKLSEIAE